MSVENPTEPQTLLRYPKRQALRMTIKISVSLYGTSCRKIVFGHFMLDGVRPPLVRNMGGGVKLCRIAITPFMTFKSRFATSGIPLE